MKKKNANGREKSKQKNHYVLSEEKHGMLVDTFFQVQSVLDIIGDNCRDHSAGNQDLLNISNCLDLIKDKLKGMGSLLIDLDDIEIMNVRQLR